MGYTYKIALIGLKKLIRIFTKSKLILNAWEHQTVAHASPGQTLHWLTDLVSCIPCFILHNTVY